MIYKKIYSDVNKNRSVLVAKICLVVMAGFTTWSLLSSFGISTFAKQNRLLYFEAAFVAAYMIALIIYCILIGSQKKCLWKVLFWNAGIVCVAAPLLVVNPIGCHVYTVFDAPFGTAYPFRRRRERKPDFYKDIL